jgi:predicted DNA-binding transcriptional regulator AlpA
MANQKTKRVRRRKSERHSIERQISTTSSAPRRLYRPAAVAEMLSIDRSTLHRWRQNGDIPKPVKIGGIVGWTETQLRTFLAEREAEASNAA